MIIIKSNKKTKFHPQGKLEKKNLRIKRIAHSKAKGRVINYQSISITGNCRDFFG